METITVAEAAEELSKGSNKKVSTQHVYGLINNNIFRIYTKRYKPGIIFLSKKEVEDSLKPELKNEKRT